MARQSIPVKLEADRVILEGSRTGSADLKSRLALLSYNEDALDVGYDKYLAAGGARITAFAERGDRSGATSKVVLLRQKVDGQFSVAFHIADTVFENDPDARQTLGLDHVTHAAPRQPQAEGAAPPEKRESRAQAAVLDKAHVFYKGLLNQPALLAEMAKVGYPQTRLQAELDDVQALEAADIVQEAEKAEATAGTAGQTAALKDLDEWIKRFKGIVVPGLKDRPDLLAKLGLKPRGGKR